MYINFLLEYISLEKYRIYLKSLQTAMDTRKFIYKGSRPKRSLEKKKKTAITLSKG